MSDFNRSDNEWTCVYCLAECIEPSGICHECSPDDEQDDVEDDCLHDNNPIPH